jgi:hypothetical protein
LPDIERGMLHNATFDDICCNLWHDLDASEQRVLSAVANQQNTTLQPADRASLRMKGLLVGGPDSIFSTLFEAYIQRTDVTQIETRSQNGSRRLTLSKLQDPNAGSIHL